MDDAQTNDENEKQNESSDNKEDWFNYLQNISEDTLEIENKSVKRE